MRIYILLLFAIVAFFKAEAQSRILPVTESPSSPKSLSLGNSKMGNIDNAFIYNNPTALFYSTSKAVDYSLGIIPSESENTYLLHTLTTAYRNGKSAFFVGGRYLSMGSFDNWLNNDMEENSTLGKISFYSYTIDLGYAYKLNEAFSFYSTVGYVKEKTVASIWAYRVDLGSYYNGNGNLFNKDVTYSVGISAGNLGKYSYKSKTDFLSPNVRLGGSIMIPTASNQTIETFLDGGVFLPVADNKSTSFISIGFDYSFFKKYSLRIGGHSGDNDDFFSAGFGVKYKIFDFSFGSKIALRKDLENMYMLGLKVGI